MSKRQQKKKKSSELLRSARLRILGLGRIEIPSLPSDCAVYLRAFRLLIADPFAAFAFLALVASHVRQTRSD